VVGVLVLLFVGLVAFTGYAHHSWTRQQSEIGSQPSEIVAPGSGDLATVRARLAALATVVASPAAEVPAHRPAAARQARLARAWLIEWRDSFELTAHQTRVLHNAVGYAGALSRWLRTPRDAARHAAALRAWRVWRADDPGLRTK
jgi:hypothetical protein